MKTRRGRRVFPAATEAINDLPVSAIDTSLVLKVLEPLWPKTLETASRIRGRIEAVLDFAKVRGEREGENPHAGAGISTRYFRTFRRLAVAIMPPCPIRTCLLSWPTSGPGRAWMLERSTPDTDCSQDWRADGRAMVGNRFAGAPVGHS